MRKFTTLLSCLILVSLPSICLAAEYAHGHQALEIFDAEGFSNAPLWVQIWVGFMLLSYICGLAFVRQHSIARWVVGGLFAGLTLGTLLGHLLGLPALSGFIALVHLIFWSPGLYLLLKNRPFLGPKSAFSIWTGVMTLVILFSFVFDIRDAYIYLQHII